MSDNRMMAIIFATLCTMGAVMVAVTAWAPPNEAYERRRSLEELHDKVEGTSCVSCHAAPVEPKKRDDEAE